MPPQLSVQALAACSTEVPVAVNPVSLGKSWGGGIVGELAQRSARKLPQRTCVQADREVEGHP